MFKTWLLFFLASPMGDFQSLQTLLSFLAQDLRPGPATLRPASNPLHTPFLCSALFAELALVSPVPHVLWRQMGDPLSLIGFETDNNKNGKCGEVTNVQKYKVIWIITANTPFSQTALISTLIMFPFLPQVVLGVPRGRLTSRAAAPLLCSPSGAS